MIRLHNEVVLERWKNAVGFRVVIAGVMRDALLQPFVSALCLAPDAKCRNQGTCFKQS